ncbi:MAG: hypothetical protein M3Z46_00995 [Actinomycetota bacterium]|nr:hypothetical protein [Actinomycetota bacterium]
MSGRLLLAIGLAVVVLAAATTGCSSDAKSAKSAKSSSRAALVAATVAGTKVPVANITADLAAEVTAGKKGKAKTDPSSPLASPKDAKSGNYTPAASAAALTNRIIFTLYGQQLAAHHATVEAIDKQRARQSLCADATTGQAPAGSSCPPLAAYPAAYRTFQLSLRERELAFGKVLYGRVFDVVKRTQPTLLREVCLNLVQVASQTEGADIVKKMKSGATMTAASKSAAAAGKASSVQPGCLFAAAAPASLANAKKGAVVPVQGQSVLGVAEVTSFKTATRAEFATQPPSSAATVQKLLKAEVDRSIRKSKVTVDRTYGHWDPTKLVVVAPASKTKTTTTTAGSLGATTAVPTTASPSTTATKSTTTP